MLTAHARGKSPGRAGRGGRRFRRRLDGPRAAFLALSAAVALGVVTPTPATATGSPSCNGEMTYNPVTGEYTCTVPGGTTPGGPTDPGGSGGSGEPTCDLRDEATYCIDTLACWDEPMLPPIALPEGPKPSEDSEAMVTWCYSPFGGSRQVHARFWSDEGEPPPPSLQEQAQTAIGQIDVPPGTLTTSPAGRSLVNVDTWFWLDGAAERAQGSSAFGLVATAVASSISVDPGDGGEALTCPVTTSAAQAETSCFHVYRRSSTEGSAQWRGRPAYAASATVTYDLSFAVDGTPVTIEGAPTTLTSDPATTAVRVDEVQAIVRQRD